MLPDSVLQSILTLLEETTPGHWTWIKDEHGEIFIDTDNPDIGNRIIADLDTRLMCSWAQELPRSEYEKFAKMVEADAEFMALTHEIVPQLIAQIRQQRNLMRLMYKIVHDLSIFGIGGFMPADDVERARKIVGFVEENEVFG